MESLNLSSDQSTRNDGRKPSDNANCFSCASCNIRKNDQCNSFKNFYPGKPDPKHISEKCEENHSFHTPVFSSSTLFHPFLNNSIAPNLYFPQSNLNPIANFTQVPESLKQMKIKNEKLLQQASSFQGYLFCPMEKEDAKQWDQIKNQKIENQQSQPNQNGWVQQCSCNSLLPWNCSPYVVPIVSYYVLWNSRQSNPIPLCSSTSCSQTENFFQKRNEDKMCECCPHIKSNFSSNIKEHQIKNEEIELKKETQENYGVEDKLTKNEWHANEQNRQNSSLVSFKNLDNENGYKVENKVELKDSLEKNKFEDIDTEKVLENLKKELGETNYTECCHYAEFLSSTITEEEPNSQIGDKSENSEFFQELKDTHFESDFENEIQFSDIPLEGRKISSSELISTDQLTEKKSAEDFVIKTTENEQLEAKNSSDAAAAGDLGGINCIGYKINISPDENNKNNSEMGKIRQETETEEILERKKILEDAAKILENLETRENSKVVVLNENTNTNNKNPRNFKSGIAKLTNIYKFKDLSTGVSLNIPETKDFTVKESTLIKRKCQGTEHTENNLRVHRLRKGTMVEQSLEKAFSVKPGAKNLKNKKEEKISLKNLSQGKVEKRGKSVSKK